MRVPEQLGNSPPERLLRAYHEAGHAVIGLARRLDLLRVEIADDHGKCEWSGLVANRPSIEMTTAGHQAVIRLAKLGLIPSNLTAGDDNDQIQAMGFALKLAGIGGDVELAQLAIETARESVALELREAETWADVERLAQALLERLRLGRGEIDELLGRE